MEKPKERTLFFPTLGWLTLVVALLILSTYSQEESSYLRWRARRAVFRGDERAFDHSWRLLGKLEESASSSVEVETLLTFAVTGRQEEMVPKLLGLVSGDARNRAIRVTTKKAALCGWLNGLKQLMQNHSQALGRDFSLIPKVVYGLESPMNTQTATGSDRVVLLEMLYHEFTSPGSGSHGTAGKDLADAMVEGLVAAARLGAPDLTAWFLARGVNPNLWFPATSTLPLVAALRPEKGSRGRRNEKNVIEVFRLLLAAGANPDLDDPSGISAREILQRHVPATHPGVLEMIRLLPAERR
jgi:hypothetical protein